MAGAGGVGKTTMVHRFVEGVFLADTQFTIGVEFFLKEIEIENTKILLQTWDFAGQPQFRFLHKNYARGAKGALLLFDLTRPTTLESIGEWVNICRADGIDIPILLVGSKADLIESSHIEPMIIEAIRKKFNLFDYIEVSSKTGQGVELAFKKLAKKIIEHIISF